MILKIILLVLILICIFLLIFFLFYLFVPAVKSQTGIYDNVLMSKYEHKFEKLKNVAQFSPITQKAIVMCSCNKTFKKEPLVKLINGQSCSLINLTFQSVNDCKYSCIGLGDCISFCPQEAIQIKNKTAVISDLCNGCGRCISRCPKNLIKLVPIGTELVKYCKNTENSTTSCSDSNKEQKIINFETKKGFKIWQTCYRILKK